MQQRQRPKPLWRVEETKPLLSHIRIILVEPAGPLNVGSVARVMKNFGLTQLVLVRPRCDRHDPESLQMAVHARDLLDKAQIVDSLPAALVGVQRAIATTGEVHDIPTALEPPRQVLPWLLSPPPSPSIQGETPTSKHFEAALIFGREDHGLSGQELHYAQRLLKIPSDAAYTSLNLAQAVAVCCYELSQGAHQLSEQAMGDGHASINTVIPSQPPQRALPDPQVAEDQPATLEALEGYYEQCEALLLEIGYLLPHTVTSRMKRFRRLYHRAQPSDREVKMLRGILRQMRWALHNLPRSK